MKLPTGCLAIAICFSIAAAKLPASDWVAASLPAPSPAAASAGTPTWYRCFIRVPAKLVTPAEKDLWRDSITLNLAAIHGPFIVYLNGQKIADANEAPDGPRRRFKVPKGILRKDVFNVLAIRLDPRPAARGIGQTPIFAGYLDELPLDGTWDVFRGEVDPATLTPTANRPENASYVESGFKPASSPLGRNPDLIPGVRVPPDKSLAMMKPASDLTIDLIASEPAVAQPTHISFDERGRMWVAQYRQYPYPAGLKMISRDMYYRARFDKIPPAPPHQDKGADIVTVHEDTHGDGVFDKHTVVLDGLNMANAAVYGHGGVWVMNTPYLMFYADSKGNGLADGAPEVRLAGFGLEDTHSVANGLTWGPDGWLYGGQGSTTTSRIVRPGIDPPNFPGVYFEGCMVWRYHPEKKIYEIFAQGGGNTFGLDFDSEGRVYSGHNGGVIHGFYFVQDGIYLKQGVDVGKFGPAANPYTFGQLPPIKSRNPIARFTHDIVMFEGNALPPRYVGRMFGADPLHRCLTLSERYPVGSSFETSDDEKPLTSDDPTFRPVYLCGGPDGALYIADFCEEYIAHGQNYQGQIDPTSGRIYRLRGKETPLNKDVNIAGKTTAELVKLLIHPNRWHRQTAVRLLGQRHDARAIEPLKALLKEPVTHPALESLWALHQMGALDESTAESLMAHPAAMVRAWTIRLMGDARVLPIPFYDALHARIAAESDPEVRCQIAATSRRLPVAQALPIVSELLKHDGDAQDAFIPLLCWLTIESHCDDDRDAVLAMFKDPAAWSPAMVKQWILPRVMRRFAAKGGHADYLGCAHLLETAPTAEHRKILMDGFEAAFTGRSLPPLPSELAAALARSGRASPLLRVRLGDPAAIAAALKIAADPKTPRDERLTGVALFGEVKAPQSVPVLLAISKEDPDPALQQTALTALQLYDDPAIGSQVAGFYASLSPAVRPSALNLLASRSAWSMAFLRLVESDAIPATVPADVATRLRAQDDPRVAALAAKLFPAPKPPAKTARTAEVLRVRKIIEAGAGDPYKGEATFMQRCAACHTLFHKGGKIGPNLTSYQRDDLGTMLISIVDPSAEIREGYQNFMVRTKDGRTLSGFLSDSDAQMIALRGLDGQDVRVARGEIAVLKAMTTSIMPEGLLGGLEDQDLRNFFAYLRIPQPISR
ncbi:MAG TPA: PVC-type heme-binding CxxCH protein [Tepidisphaeraceae bacterium]|nr:PVC-type heme-binding CxxCH protein [Tepidisphaeraceae bacterium]